MKSRSSRTCCSSVHAENPRRWHEIVKEWRGVSEETTTGVHRLIQDAGSRQAAGGGHQRERFGDQVEVRQSVRLPRVAGGRHQARHRRDGGGQSGGGVRLRRRGQGLGAFAARHGRARGGDRRSTHQRPAGGHGRLRSDHRRGYAGARRYLRHLHRQLRHHHPGAHEQDEGPGDRVQHRPLRQRDPGGPAERLGGGAAPTSSRRWTCTPSRTATAFSCWRKGGW